MKLLLAIIASSAIVFGAAWAADSTLNPRPNAAWQRVELDGAIDGPRAMQLFGDGDKEFDLIVGDGLTSHFVQLAFASADDYATAERYDHMSVRVKGVFASRGRRQVLIVESVELRK